MLAWRADPEVYHSILRDQEAFIDALSYLCSRVKHSQVQSSSNSGDPVKVYLRQTPSFRTACTHSDVRAALNGSLAESCSPTLTLFGLITSVCGPISTHFGFQQRCNACGCVAPDVVYDVIQVHGSQPRQSTSTLQDTIW